MPESQPSPLPDDRVDGVPDLEVDINDESVADTTSRRARAETIGLVVMAVVVVAAAVYALVWSTEGPSSSVDFETVSDGPSLSPTTKSSSTAPGAPDDAALALGETFGGSRASSTVERVTVLTAPDGPAAPEGDAWFGFFVTRCASETTSSAKAPWSRWVVVGDDGEVYRGSDDVPDGIVEQRLTTRDFPAGECRAGWVIVAVPEDVADSVESVRFVPPSGKPASWRVGA